MQRAIDQDGATCPDSAADGGNSVRADIILDVATFEVGVRIGSTLSERISHLSHIRQQGNDTMAPRITTGNHRCRPRQPFRVSRVELCNRRTLTTPIVLQK
jgi:hypothetical protein